MLDDSLEEKLDGTRLTLQQREKEEVDPLFSNISS